MIGKLLGNRYQIMEKIGSGGMAEVYKARCTLLNRYVAVKVLKDEFRVDEEFIARFNRESQAAASLSHPNIVSIYDVGCEEGMHYIVMEYVEGITLKEYIEKNGLLPWREALDFSIQICKAMEHAHKKNIIHRDIKPHNIMVTENKILKVTDFGIARTINKEGKTIDGQNAIGTVHYISPEQARGGYVDEKSDIYSMGVVLYEMLTGKPPFDNDNAVSIAIMHMQQPPKPPREFNVSIPAALEQVCLKAMAKEQSQRFQSASEMLEALAAVERQDGNTMIAPAVGERADAPTTIIDSEEIKERLDVPENKRSNKRSTKKAAPPQKGKRKIKKEDKVAIIAAIIASLIIVAIFSVVVINIVSPGFFGGMFGSSDDGIERVPDLVGRNIDEVKDEYKDSKKITIEEAKERVDSAEYPEGTIVKQDPEAEKDIKNKRKVKIKVTVSKGSKLDELPDFTNKDVSSVEKVLKENKIKYSIVEEYDESVLENFVIRQVPAKGKKVTADLEVILYVSKGQEDKRVEVPYVIGLSESQAKKTVEQQGLVWGSVSRADSDKPEGTVIDQNPSYQTEVNKKTEVNVTVSNGKAPATPTPTPTQEATPTPPPTQQPATPTPAQKTRYLTVSLPQDRQSVQVMIKINGNVVYNETRDTAPGSVDVRLIGSGTAQAEVYLDGVLSGTQTIQFD